MAISTPHWAERQNYDSAVLEAIDAAVFLNG